MAVTQHCEALVKQCAELGAQILDNAAALLAPGGEMIYSTCTFAPEEDEGQVAAFLARHPEFALAHVFGRVDYSFGSAGEANRTGGLPLDVSKVRRIWPCQGGEGHFIARLVKAGTPRTLPAPGGVHARRAALAGGSCGAEQKQKPGKGKPARAESRDARASRRENARVLREEVQGKRGRRAGDSGAGESASRPEPRRVARVCRPVFPGAGRPPRRRPRRGVLLPVPFPQTGLHVLRAGVFVGSVQKGRFIPEHHLFTAFGARCTNRGGADPCRPAGDRLSVGPGRWRPPLRRTAGAALRWTATPSAAAKCPPGGSKTTTPKPCGCCKRGVKPRFLPDFVQNPPDKA